MYSERNTLVQGTTELERTANKHADPLVPLPCDHTRSRPNNTPSERIVLGASERTPSLCVQYTSANLF